MIVQSFSHKSAHATCFDTMPGNRQDMLHSFRAVLGLFTEVLHQNNMLQMILRKKLMKRKYSKKILVSIRNCLNKPHNNKKVPAAHNVVFLVS